MEIFCPYCNRPAEMVTGAEIYPRRIDLRELKFWRCKPCGAHVGCHKVGKGQGDGTQPLGRLANRELREAKQAAHASFDPLWQLHSNKLTRRAAYVWLAKELKIPFDQCHIGMFDVDQCNAVVAAIHRRGQ